VRSLLERLSQLAWSRVGASIRRFQPPAPAMIRPSRTTALGPHERTRIKLARCAIYTRACFDLWR
jgi:hypothetical protein